MGKQEWNWKSSLWDTSLVPLAQKAFLCRKGSGRENWTAAGSLSPTAGQPNHSDGGLWIWRLEIPGPMSPCTHGNHIFQHSLDSPAVPRCSQCPTGLSHGWMHAFMYMHTCMKLCTLICIHAYAHIHVHTHMCTCMYTVTRIYMCTKPHMCRHTCVHAQMPTRTQVLWNPVL